MSALPEVGLLFSVFVAGLLGSGHCFGMCGGIAGGLGSMVPQKSAGRIELSLTANDQAVSAVLFNLGRLLSYALLGLLAAWIMTRAGPALQVPRWGMILRLLTALMIFLIGLQFLFDLHLLGFIERTGAKIWRQAMPLAVRAASLPGVSGRVLLGLCWGLLPCGLVYSILLTAAASGSAFHGAMVMFVFGLGTLPSMLGMSLFAPLLGNILSDRWTRKIIGIALIILAINSLYLLKV